MGIQSEICTSIINPLTLIKCFLEFLIREVKLAVSVKIRGSFRQECCSPQQQKVHAYWRSSAPSSRKPMLSLCVWRFLPCLLLCCSCIPPPSPVRAPQVVMDALPATWQGSLLLVDHMAGFVSVHRRWAHNSPKDTHIQMLLLLSLGVVVDCAVSTSTLHGPLNTCCLRCEEC